MAVYIDSFNAPFRGMIMCHMVADTTEELLEMARKVGLNKKWIQDAGTPREHFDICLAKKKQALQLGALQISLRQLAEFLLKREAAAKEAADNHL